MVVVGIACGLAGAFGAIVFRFLIRFFQALFFEGPAGVAGVLAGNYFAEATDPLEAALALPFYWRALIPALGGLIVGPLVYFFAREAKGHGVPEVMESVALRGGVIRRRVVAVKTLASAISIGSGGSVGREGPIVQIGSAIGSMIGQVLRLPARERRAIVSCGAAAGVAATFNAPIAGAFFAAEVIIGDFAVGHFAPIVISSVVATVVSRFVLGNHPIFEVASYELVSPFELFPYLLLGVLCGLVAVTFILTLNKSEDLFERFPIPEYTKAAFGGLLVGCIGISLPQVFGVGYSSITAALGDQWPAATLGLLMLAKILATSITIGSGGSGGIFAPSLFLGAMTGGFFGSYVHQAFPSATANSGAYALVAMGAVVAAATHAPLTAIIIIFELTQSITIVPPLMAACVVSTLVARRLYKESIYTSKLQRRGVDLEQEQDPNVLKRLRVRDAVDSNPELIDEAAPFQTLLDSIAHGNHSEFFVVNRKRELIGAINLREISRMVLEMEHLAPVVVAADLIDGERPTLTEDDTLDVAMQLFSHDELEEIAVVSGLNRRHIVGSLRKRDVIKIFNRETLRRDVAGTMSSSVRAGGKHSQFDLGDGYVFQELPAPTRMFQKTLRELSVREQTGVQVILVRKHRAGPGGSLQVPGPEYRIEAGDQLLVAGRKADVEKLQRLS